MSFLVFVTVQAIEHKKGKPLFTLPGMKPYLKVLEASVDISMDNESKEAEEDDYSV